MLTLEPSDLVELEEYPCDHSNYQLTLDDRRRGAQSHCTQCKLVLACVDWAALGHFDVKDVSTTLVLSNGLVAIWLLIDNKVPDFVVECSRLDSKCLNLVAFPLHALMFVQPSLGPSLHSRDLVLERSCRQKHHQGQLSRTSNTGYRTV